MKPTILEGDRIVVNKLAYDLKFPYTTLHLAEWADPQRGDIVVFYSPVDGSRLVKRIIGIPGDSLAMQDNQLIINGGKVSYTPAAAPLVSAEQEQTNLLENLAGVEHQVLITPQHPELRSFRPVVIPAGNYFMMGDNRDNSADSRYFGFVKRSQIVGRATAVAISLDINNQYRPRWERFFTALP